MLFLSLEAAVFAEEQRELVSVTQAHQLSATQRAKERTSRTFDDLTRESLGAITSDLKKLFKPATPSGGEATIQHMSTELNPGKLRWLDIRPVSWPSLEPEPSSLMDIDDKPNGHITSRTPTTVTPPHERHNEPKQVISLLSTESSLPKKKARQTVYGKPNRVEEIDSSKDSDSGEPPATVELGFKTASEKYNEDALRDGKPLLKREPKDNGDKKRKRDTVEELAGWTGDEDDNISVVGVGPKRRTLMAHVTSSIVGKSNKPLHPPVGSNGKSNGSHGSNGANGSNGTNGSSNGASSSKSNGSNGAGEEEKEVYKGIDPEIAERVLNEILDTNMNVKWTDIAGLEDVKQTLHEMIIFPNLHPEMFTGLRAPPRGLLLFGPPGNGKTMIAKAIATEAGLTFFSISASVLTSKWIGEGEKTMKALFTIARAKAPSFIFIDEVDSILCSRSSEEHESSRRLKNEFLTQFDGATSSAEDAVTIMGATNRPFDLDDAARRRMPKRIYVPLPEQATRYNLLSHLLNGESHCLTDAQVSDVAEKLQGYSCSDIHQLSQQAAMGPVRDKMRSGMMTGGLRAITTADFEKAIETTRPSVAPEECKLYEDFAGKFGTKGF